MISDFETDRLRVRDWRDILEGQEAPEWLQSDLGQILTPNVLRHLPPSMQLGGSNDAIADWVTLQAGSGETFLVQDRHTGRLLGLVVLARFGAPPEPVQIHIGYLLAEAAWGKGMATELVRGLVKAMPLDMPMTLLGGVGKDNPGSARVLEKAGFSKDSNLSTEDTDMFAMTIGD